MADLQPRRKPRPAGGIDQDDRDFAQPSRYDPSTTVSGRRDGAAPEAGTAGLLKVVVLLASVGVVFVLALKPDFFSDIFRDLTRASSVLREGGDAQESRVNVNGVTLFTKEELARHSGEDTSKPILLAYMGKVYDVTKGRRHYGPGGSYSFFSGKDATRSFLTGDFKNDLTDSLEGVGDSMYGQIESWEDTYSKSSDYKQVGVLCGEFYQCAEDAHPGEPTEKLIYAQKMILKAKADEAKENEIYKEFPQCNSEWSQDNGGRVWCSPKSGGVERGWTGFPRLLLYQKPGGSKSTRCACVHRDKLRDLRLELYPDCHPDAESCKTGH